MRILLNFLLQFFRSLNTKTNETVITQPTPAPTPEPTPEPEPEPVMPRWPISKEHMAYIMGRRIEEISDELMDDYATCCETFQIDPFSQAYFLGQCGHESAGLKYAIEWHDGSNYEFRSDLGNLEAGDGVKFAGTGWLQNTGRYNHQRFSDYLKFLGKEDLSIMEIGKTYTAQHYPFSISGFWWHDNKMNQYCAAIPTVDSVGARVNGRYLPNGYEDRRKYSRKAFDIMGIPYPGN